MPTATETATVTPLATPTATSTLLPTLSATVTPLPTATETPTVTPLPTATATATPPPTATPTPTPTPLFSLGNRVWHDLDNNALLEDGEPGLDGVTVNLLAETGAVLSSTVTANGGYYQFDRLPAGIYSLEVLPPTGMASSSNLASSIDPNNGLDKDDNGVLLGVSAVRSNSIALGLAGSMPLAETDQLPTASLDASSNLTIDFGFYLPVRVGDYVWYDNNYNGIQDGEPGVAGVRATLYSAATNLPVPDGNGNPLTRITDANGLYQFDNLPPGDYYVLFDLQTLPASYQLTRQNVGAGGSNSNADISAKTSNTGFLASGGENLSLDVGIYANFDLALRKRLGDGQPGTVNPGDPLRWCTRHAGDCR